MLLLSLSNAQYMSLSLSHTDVVLVTLTEVPPSIEIFHFIILVLVKSQSSIDGSTIRTRHVLPSLSFDSN